MFFDPWVIVRGNAARPGEAKDAAGPADAPPAAPSPARRAIFDGLPRRRRRTYTAEAAFFLATPADRSWGDGELLDLVCRQINPANWDETSATFGATRVCCVERGQPDDGRWEGALRETVSFPVFPADSRLGRLGLGPLVELRTVLRVRMSRSRFQARVEYRIGAECLASRAADRCSPGEFGNGVLDIDEGELVATELGGVVVAIRDAIDVPVKLVGTGETPEDVQPFDPDQFVEAMFSA